MASFRAFVIQLLVLLISNTNLTIDYFSGDSWYIEAASYISGASWVPLYIACTMVASVKHVPMSSKFDKWSGKVVV